MDLVQANVLLRIHPVNAQSGPTTVGHALITLCRAEILSSQDHSSDNQVVFCPCCLETQPTVIWYNYFSVKTLGILNKSIL